jgi:hypothetical protein
MTKLTMNLDSIGFGNPTIEQVKELNRETYLDTLFSELTGFTFPQNSSEATKEELNAVVKAVDGLKRDEERRKRYMIYDVYIEKFYRNYLSKYKVDADEMNKLIDDITNDVQPLIYKLKYFFQRPRPHQLAYYYKLKLMPYTSLSYDTPSFPSGHVVLSKVYSEILGNTYPQIYNELQRIHEDICDSRIALGLHYQSDVDVAIFVGEKICENKELMIKYQI